MGAIPTKTELIDLAYRTFWTFAAALIGNVAAVGTDNLSLAAFQSMAIAAAYSALVTVVKTYVSNKNGTGTASERATPAFGAQPVASNNAVPAGTTQEIVPAGVVPPREPVITQDPPPVPPPAA